MNIFQNLPGLIQNRSESIGIDTRSVPEKFGGPSMFITATNAMFAFGPGLLQTSDTVFANI